MRFKNLLLSIFILMLSVILVISFTDVSFAGNSSTMKQVARTIASKDKYKHTYVIVTSVGLHMSKVYQVNKSKKTVTEVTSSKSCVGKPTIRSGKNKFFRMSAYKKKDKNGSQKDSNGKSYYHEYYMRGYGSNGFAIHSCLYAAGQSTRLYNNVKKKWQDASQPFKYNWSNGCTRTSKSFAQFVFNRCGEGTPYCIY